MNNKKHFNSLVAGVLAAVAIQASAQTAPLDTADQPATPTPVARVLEDKVHQLSNTLKSPADVHLYSFVAVRGQNVLVATPHATTYGKQWRLEYRVDGGEWKAKGGNWPEKIESLTAGSTVDVRVVAVEGAQVSKENYQLVFGSYPHMRYDFHHQEGFLKMPYGSTDPDFLATQAFTEAMLDVSFRDSKGHPLEGGVAEFTFKPNSSVKSETTTYTSDSVGKVLELIKFSGCEGGNYAEPFIHFNNGRNTWATRYRVGEYKVLNVLPETLADKPHLYQFGHICKRWLINWSRN